MKNAVINYIKKMSTFGKIVFSLFVLANLLLAYLLSTRVFDFNAAITIFAIVLLLIISNISAFFYTKYKGRLRKNRFALVLLILLSLFLILSVSVPIYEYANNIGIAILMIISVIICIDIFTILVIISGILSGIKIKKSKKKVHIYDLFLFMIIPLGVGFFSLLGVYPGVSSGDTATCWTSAMLAIYQDAHPITYLGLMRVLYILTGQLLSLTIFQIVLSSFTFAYLSYRFKELGVHTWVCYLFIIIVTFIPSNLLLSLNLLKDVPYTFGIILLSAEILRMLTNARYFKKFGNYILLGLFAFLTLISRHNGYYVVLFMFALIVMYYLIQRNKKLALRCFIVGFVIITSFTQIKTSAINNARVFIENTFTSASYFSIPAHGLVMVYANHYDEMDNIEKGILEKYVDIEGADITIAKYTREEIPEMWKYHDRAKDTINYDNLFSVTTDRKVQTVDYLKTYLHYLKMYPEDIVMSVLRITNICWSIPEYGYTGTTVIDSVIPAEYPEIYTQDIKSETSREFVEIMYSTTSNPIGMIAFWRPSLYFALVILVIASSKKSCQLILIFSPVLLNHLSYFAAIEGQNVRYVYGSITMLFVMLLIHLYNINLLPFTRDKRHEMNILLTDEQNEKLTVNANSRGIQSEDVVVELIDNM